MISSATREAVLVLTGIDLESVRGVSPNGMWTLLEVNPNGEWGWLAHHCDLPIGQAIADLLEKGRV